MCLSSKDDLTFSKNKYLFIYFWLHWVFAVACRLSLVAIVVVQGLLIAVVSLVAKREP